MKNGAPGSDVWELLMSVVFGKDEQVKNVKFYSLIAYEDHKTSEGCKRINRQYKPTTRAIEEIL